MGEEDRFWKDPESSLEELCQLVFGVTAKTLIDRQVRVIGERFCAYTNILSVASSIDLLDLGIRPVFVEMAYQKREGGVRDIAAFERQYGIEAKGYTGLDTHNYEISHLYFERACRRWSTRAMISPLTALLMTHQVHVMRMLEEFGISQPLLQKIPGLLPPPGLIQKLEVQLV